MLPIKRNEYLNKIKPFMHKNIVKILTGMRRSGKSVMLTLLQNELIEQGIPKDKFIAINFESAPNAPLKYSDNLYAHLMERISQLEGKSYLFLDEIQEVDQWQKVINSLMVDADTDIYLTGSNAKLLSGEFATYLAGRYIEIEIFPFSFKEALIIAQILSLPFDDKNLFLQYVRFGGMPFLFELGYGKEYSLKYLEDIYQSVVLKDVVERHQIRDAELLNRLILYLMSNIGSHFSSKSIADYLKNEKRSIAPETIYNYMKSCKDAYLFQSIPRQNLKGKKILKTQEKVFLTDHGIREAIYGNNSRDIEKILENIVCIELLRRGYQVSIGSINEQEIDFVAEKQGEKAYFQVSYVLASQETVRREFEPLMSIKDNFPKYVLTLLDEVNQSSEGIHHLNIRDFLSK